MTPRDHDRQVDYIEFGATDIGRTKQFYEAVFGWEFQDYGPDYTSFQDGRLSGGFTKGAPGRPPQPPGGVFPARPGATGGEINQGRGTIVRPTYSFPGRRPLPFLPPSRNQLGL